MKFKDTAVMFLATGCYLGKVPFAPGTFGSLFGLLLCFLLSGIHIGSAIFITVLFVGGATWISQIAEKLLNKEDPGCIVIDEMAGMMVTFIGLPFNLFTAVAGFVVFRLLDILKPPPIRALERQLPGGIGVVMDDVVAGMIGNIILRISLLLMG